jgi:hypothetical protein
MTLEQATLILAGITGLLVLATIALAVIAGLQVRMTARQTADQREATAVLRAQAAALSESAAAGKATANELFEQRKAANPLGLVVQRAGGQPGELVATIYARTNAAPAILDRAELYLGQGSNLEANPADRIVFGNAYVTNESGAPINLVFARPPFDEARGDFAVLRVTGKPRDGLEQTREFLYRVSGDRHLIDLGVNDSTVPWTAV